MFSLFWFTTIVLTLPLFYATWVQRSRTVKIQSKETQVVGWLIWIQAESWAEIIYLKMFYSCTSLFDVFFLIWFQSIFINGKHRDSQQLICLRVPAIDFCGLSPNWPQIIWDGTRGGDAAICGLSAYEISEGFDHCNCKLIQICLPVLNGTNWIMFMQKK